LAAGFRHNASVSPSRWSGLPQASAARSSSRSPSCLEIISLRSDSSRRGRTYLIADTNLRSLDPRGSPLRRIGAIARPGTTSYSLIRRLVDERPTHGYRRIRRLINRQGKADGKPPVNGKRVQRIMQANKLTLERHTGHRPERTHDGVVIALRSNIRWCSDHFELGCRNDEIVRVLFAIDACDREVMAWLAASAGISSEMVRDLMVAASNVDSGSARRRMLSNGCPTTARLKSPRTRSTPQPPWASSFVSRQSARRNPTASRRHSSKPSNAITLGCAETLIALLPAWFEDYNEVHPHSGLKFLSPREFLRLSA
jgi:putative transposase